MRILQSINIINQKSNDIYRYIQMCKEEKVEHDNLLNMGDERKQTVKKGHTGPYGKVYLFSISAPKVSAKQ